MLVAMMGAVAGTLSPRYMAKEAPKKESEIASKKDNFSKRNSRPSNNSKYKSTLKRKQSVIRIAAFRVIGL